MMIEFTPGTEFYVNNEKCIVVPDKHDMCGHCVFNDNYLCGHIACCFSERHDSKSIRIEKIK